MTLLLAGETYRTDQEPTIVMDLGVDRFDGEPYLELPLERDIMATILRIGSGGSTPEGEPQDSEPEDRRPRRVPDHMRGWTPAPTAELPDDSRDDGYHAPRSVWIKRKRE